MFIAIDLIKKFIIAMRQNKKVMTTFILCCCVMIGFSSTVSPTWSFTNLVQSGIKVVVQDQLYLENSYDYVYTYSPAFSQAPFTALGICGFQVSNLHETHMKFLVNIPDYTSSTQLTVRMNHPTATQWRHFKVSYIAIDKAFSGLKVDYLSDSSWSTVSTGVGTRSQTGTFNLNIGPLDTTHTMTIIPLLVGIDSTTVNGEFTVFWTIAIKDANSITYDLTVKHTTRVSSITSYILIVDRTATEVGYEVFLDQIEVTGTDNVGNGQTLIASNTNNLHMGLNSFQFTLAAFDIDTNLALTSQGFFKAIEISVWSYRERTCAASHPYFQSVSSLCHVNCPDNSIEADGATMKYCRLCNEFIDHCQKCTTGGTVCTSCWGNYQLQPGNTECKCIDGYYESAVYQYQDSSVKCRLCHSFCSTCNEETQNDCLSCPYGRTLDGTFCKCDYDTYPNGQCINPCNDTKCYKCPNDTAVCTECVDTFILESQRCVCGQRRYYDFSTQKCYDCDPTCQYCDGPLSNNCIYCDNVNDLRYLDQGYCLCIANYYDVNGTCERQIQTECLQEGFALNPATSMCDEVCGDGILHQMECDDKNNRNGDGCTHDCKIQDGFVCADNTFAPTRRSYCSYTAAIEFSVKWIEKDIFANEVNITYTMKPVLSHVFQVYSQLTQNTTYEPAQYLITTKSATYDKDTQEFLVEIQYETDIEDKDITLVFKIPETAETFAVPISKQTHKLKADNILAAMAHNSESYDSVNIFNVVGMVCYLGSLIFGGVLLFYRKMMGLQLLILLQFMYFGVLLADYLHPFLGPFQLWQFINGYNDFFIRSDSADLTPVNNTFRVYHYYDQFVDNCNAMIVISLALYFLCFVVFLLSLLAEKSTSKKFLEGAKFFAMEIGFGLMVISLNNITVSIALEAYSGKIGDWSFYWSKLFALIAIIMVVAHLVVFFFNVHTLTDSSLYYKRHKDYTHYYPIIFIVRNTLLIVSIILRPTLGQNAAIIALAAEGIYIISVIAGRPYRKFVDYVRFFGIQSTLMLFIVSRFIEAKYIKTQYDSEWGTFFLYSAYVILVGLLLSLVFTIVSFIYHFCRGLKKDENPQTNYIPPTLLLNDKGKSSEDNNADIFSPVKNEKQGLLKSKQMVILDVQEDMTGASVPNKSVYSKNTRDLSAKKGKKRKNPYV